MVNRHMLPHLRRKFVTFGNCFLMAEFSPEHCDYLESLIDHGIKRSREACNLWHFGSEHDLEEFLTVASLLTDNEHNYSIKQQVHN